MTGIYYLSTLTFPSRYANRVQVLKMADAFSALVPVTLFGTRVSGTSEGVRKRYGLSPRILFCIVRGIRLKPRSFWRAFFLRKHIRRAPEGTVFYAREIMLTLFLTLLSRKFRESFFLESHSLHRFPKKLYRFLFFRARGIIVTNRFKKELLIEWGIPEERILVEPNGIDAKRFKKLTTLEDARDALGIPRNLRVILYLGVFSPDRGVDVFFNAALRADASVGDFYAVGATELQKKELEAKYRAGHIHIRELVPYEKVPLYYSAADCLVAPWSGKYDVSRIHGSPLKIPEFMYSARPLVISDLPMTREWVNDRVARLVVPDDPAALLTAIKEILKNPTLARAKAQKARAIAAEHTWDKRAERIIQFMKKDET